jgi:hypothetical protein
MSERDDLKRSLRKTLAALCRMGTSLPLLLEVMQEVVDELRGADLVPPHEKQCTEVSDDGRQIRCILGINHEFPYHIFGKRPP